MTTQISLAAPAEARSGRTFAVSLGASFVVLAVAVVVMLSIGAPTADATTYTVTNGSSSFNWSDTTRWSPSGVPGVGDVAIVGVCCPTITVDTNVNGVILNLASSGININIPAGSTLKLEPSSTMLSGNNINVNGGSLVIDTGTLATNANVVVNTGTLNLIGNLGLNAGNGSLTWNGGQITGSGTITNPSLNALAITGSGGGMTLSGATIDNFGTVTYSSNTSQSLSINSGGHIKLESGSVMQISGDDPIASDNVSSPSIDVLSGAQLSKTGGSLTTVSATVNNAGTVSAGTTTLFLNNGGTHSGTFSLPGSTAVMKFNGAHTFNTGSSVSTSTGVVKLVGGTFTVNTPFATALSMPYFDQSAGTVGGTGYMKVTSVFNWTGGSQGNAGTTEIGNTAQANLNGSAAVTLDSGRTLLNNGTLNYAPTSSVLSIDNAALLTNNGTLDLQNDAAINSLTPATSQLNNTGAATIKKSGGSLSTINCSVGFAGTSSMMPNAGGAIALTAGGTWGGAPVTIDLSAAGSAIKLAGGIFTFNAGSGGITTTGSGKLKLENSAGLLVNSGPLTINNFEQNNTSTLKSTVSALSINGTYDFTGGTIDGLGSGANVVNINGTGGILNLSGSTGVMSLTNSAKVTNAGGTVNYNASANALRIDSGSILANSAGGFNYTSSLGVLSNQTSSPNISISGGTLSRIGAGTPQVDAGVNISGGSLTTNGGSIRLAGGGSISAGLNPTQATDRIELGGTPLFSLNTGASVTGSGRIAVVSGGLVSLATTLSPANWELDNGGTVSLTAAGQLQVNGSLIWTGGTFMGPGSVSVMGAATATVTTLLGPPTIADGVTFNNLGTFNYNPTQSLTFKNTGGGGATFNNTGTFDVQGNGTTAVTGAGNSFSNSGGTVKKTSGAGAFLFNVSYNQSSGTTDEQAASGALGFSGGGTLSGGTMQALAAGSSIDFNSTPAFVITAGNLVGTTKLAGGTLTVNSVLSSPANFNQLGGTVNGTGTVGIPASNTYTMSGGQLIPTLTQVALNGNLTLDSTTSPLTIGALNVQSGGNVVWSGGTNSITTQTGAAISDSGTIDLRGAATFGAPSGGTLTINSGGTLKKTTTAGSVTIPMPVVNASGGTLQTTAGTLFLTSSSAVNHAGTFDIQAGSGLQFSNGTHNLVAPVSFSAGSGTVFIASPAVVNLGTAVTIPTLNLSGGQLTGTGNLLTTSSFSWTGGTMDGAGTTNVSSGSFSMTTGPMTLGRNLSISGNSLLNGALSVVNAIAITNGGTFDIQSSTINCASCTATFTNNGTIQASSGNVGFPIPVTGSGNLSVIGGATFNGSAAESFTTAALDNGSAQFTGNPVNIGSVTNSGSNPGVLTVMGGATTVAGTVGLGASNGTIAIYAGTLTLNGTTSAVNFALNNGTLAGSGNIGVSSSFVWNAGSMTGSGSFSSNGTGGLTGSGGAMTLSKPLINNGTMTYNPSLPSNIMTVFANTTITNDGTFNFGGQNLNASGVPVAQFANNNTFLASPTGTLNFGPAFANGNQATYLTGTTIFTNGYNQSGPMTYLNGGNIGSPLGININGGSMEGFGTVVGDLLMNGPLTIEDVSSNPATLNVTGNYTQTANGVLNIKLNGTTPGTQYDQLNVTGNVNLAGALTTTLGYAPVNGDTFKPLTFGGRPGGTDFITRNYPPIPGGGSFSDAYVAGPPLALQITATTLSADLAITQSGPSSALQGQAVNITLSVSNAGPSAATATITDTFSNASFVSATVGAGGTCTGTGPITCTFPSLPSGGSGIVTITLSATTIGTITNNATVSGGTTADPNTANNAATPLSIAVTTAADLAVTKTGPTSLPAGSNAVYTITVINNGPSTATSVTLTDPTPAGATFISASGACTSFPCALGTLANGASATVQATYSVNAGTTSINNVASVASSTTPDSNTANNTAAVGTTIGCVTAPGGPLPGDGTTGLPVNGTLFWAGSAPQYKVYFGPVGSGCQTLIATTSTKSFPYAGLQPATTYEWRVEAIAPGCPVASSTCFTFTTAPSCAQPPAPISPASGATLGSPITFTWTGVPGATDYHLFASVNGSASVDRGNTGATSLTVSLPDGTIVWYVVATVPTCGTLQSPSSSFNACNDLPAPVIAVVADAASGQSYDVTWDAIPGASKYEVDEASNANFTGASTTTVTTNLKSFQHSVNAATPFFYRVRAFGGCKQQLSGNSNTARVVLVPVVSGTPGNGPSANVPSGSKLKVVESILIPGIAGGTFPFVATADQPWLSVQPASGSLPPSGITLTVFADPSDLPNGTFTGTIIVTIGSGSGAKASTATSSVSVPVSVNLVTPVKPGSSAAPPNSALIIPSVGHLDGVNSKWQSDVRITNPTATKQSYTVTFTPDDPARGVKTTTITVAANDTTALDDIVKNWYGLGTIGDSANGALLIVPLSTSGKGLADNVSINTVVAASSRTYNVTTNGTLGQYIPAIPFSSFIAKAAAALSLQQIAQNADFRTNLGIVEGSGNPATVLISVFGNDGAKLLEQTLDLKANEQKQLNSFLGANGITLDDGRIEVQVVGGNGKVTAYASRVDNKTGDPLLVQGVSKAAPLANHYVLPGVAAINNGLANWRSDVRIYNAGDAAQAATLTFYPLNSTSAPLANSLILAPGEVKSLDDIVKSYFNLDNGGGALHVGTSADSALVVSGRTYNQTGNGSYGQFIPAVTPLDGVGKGDRALNVLQVEDSVRYRTNLGLAEVTGKPVTVEISVFVPDSKVIPKVTLQLGANEYRQTAILHDLGLSNTYNARISVRVVDGEGKITAYGSVVDMETQDPTYVSAQ